MDFQPGANVYTQGFGSRPENVEVPHIDVRPPTTLDFRYPIGKRWIDSVAGNEYVLGNFTTSNGVTTANWAFLGGTSGDLNSLTTQDLTVVTPTSGTILFDGDNTQGLSTTGSNAPGTVTVTAADWTTAQKGVGVLASDAQAIAGTGTTQAVTPHALQAKLGTQTAHGVAIGDTGATSALSWTAAGTAGQVLTSGGAAADPTWTTATFPATAGSTGTILRSNGTNWVASTDTWIDTATAGALIAATATNVVGQIVDVAVGQLLASGGVGVIPAYTASPSVTGNMTAATGFVATTAGSGITLNATTASGVASGPVVLNSRAGRVVFTSVSIAAAADLTLTMTNSSITSSSTQVVYSMDGATTGSALSVKSITPGSGTIAFVITNGTGATTTTADIGINFLVVN